MQQKSIKYICEIAYPQSVPFVLVMLHLAPALLTALGDAPDYVRQIQLTSDL